MPGFLENAANLATGGLYGEFSGLNDRIAQEQQQAFMDDPAFQQQMRIQQGLPASITFDGTVAQNQPQPQYFAPGSQGFAGRA